MKKTDFGNLAHISTVAVGSLNPVKVTAAKNAIQQYWPDAVCVGCAADSKVTAQPMSDQEAIDGALCRANEACRILDADMGVGLEGNTVDTPHGMFLSAWAVVVNGSATDATEIGLGSSGRLLLPKSIAEQIRNGEELGPLMDQVTNQQNTKQRQGAVGILTNGTLNRETGLTQAVLFALAPFVSALYNIEIAHAGHR